MPGSEIQMTLDVVFAVLLTINMAVTMALVHRVNQLQQPPSRGLVSGHPAPDFKAESLDGRAVTLADFSNRRTALVFVAPSCQPCKLAMPGYIELASYSAAQGVDLVLVSGGNAAQTRELVGEEPGAAQVLVAPRDQNDFFTRYEVPATPHFTIVERGRVVLSGLPDYTSKDWKKLTEVWKSDATSPGPPARAASPTA
jgi:peroxiredoxin